MQFPRLEEGTVPGRVLVVEDDGGLRETLCQLLSEEGIAAVGVSDGSEALRHLAEGRLPALILLDLMMPVMDGWQLRMKLRSEPRWAAIPVVIMSGHVRPGVIAGPTGVEISIGKGFQTDDLLAAVRRYVDPVS